MEAGMSDPSERTVALLAGVFHLEPHDLVADTNYPSAKAERLPVTVARYTEVEHQLARFDADLEWLAWLDGGQAARRRVIDRWRPVLQRLSTEAHDPAERELVAEARRRLSDC
jgi:hypothetical protein